MRIKWRLGETRPPQKILLIDGHHSKESFCASLADAYERGFRATIGQYTDQKTDQGGELRRLNIRDLRFDPILHEGYRRIQDLEPDLLRAQQDLLWCEHLVLVYPMWWGGPPALLKGFFDRVLLPGFAFHYHETDPFWDRLLAGRSAHVVCTSDAPSFYNFLKYGNAPHRVMRQLILEFCGFRPVRQTNIGRVRYMSEAKRQATLSRLETMGRKGT